MSRLSSADLSCMHAWLLDVTNEPPFFLSRLRIFWCLNLFFRDQPMSASTIKRQRIELDITGQKCTECRIGVACVVACKNKPRCFFGCSASTKEKPCPGPKKWQKVQVPPSLVIAYEPAEKETSEERMARIEARFAKKLKN